MLSAVTGVCQALSFRCCSLFEILHDDGALMQIARRGVVVQLEAGNEAFRRHFQEILWFLVRVNLVCAYIQMSTRNDGKRKGICSTVLALKESEGTFKMQSELAYFVRDLKILESDPYALDKGTEAAREESGSLILCVLVDGVESWAGCSSVVPFARVSDCRHGGERRSCATGQAPELLHEADLR